MSRQLDIETLTRPGGIVPVDIHTTAELVRHVLRLRTALEKIRWLEGVNPSAFKIALAALRDED